MKTSYSLSDHFLVAMPSLADPIFAHSVTYVCQHTEEGAVGLIVNKPLNLTLSDVFSQMEIEAQGSNFILPIMEGGPVHQERGFVIHSPRYQWRSTVDTSKKLAITTSKDILLALAKDEGPDEVLVSLGYCGWEAGQLEAEIAKNYWLTTPADSDIIFHVPFAERWEKAAGLIGVDLAMLSAEVGHA